MKRVKHNTGTNQNFSALSTKYWIVAACEEIQNRKKNMQVELTTKCAKQIMATKLSLTAFTTTATHFSGPFVTIHGKGKQIQKNIIYVCLYA